MGISTLTKLPRYPATFFYVIWAPGEAKLLRCSSFHGAGTSFDKNQMNNLD